MNMEEKYWEFRRERCLTAKRWLDSKDPNGEAFREYQEAREKFEAFCEECLETLLIENAEVLRRLKIGG